MAGRGPAAKAPEQRRPNSKKPAHEWRDAGGVGWRHGEVPTCPPKMTKAAKDAWAAWMRSWWAWFWEEDDLPALRQIVRLYDQVERGEFHRHAELRIAMDTYGISPKGRAERRWRPPSAELETVVDSSEVAILEQYRRVADETG